MLDNKPVTIPEGRTSTHTKPAAPPPSTAAQARIEAIRRDPVFYQVGTEKQKALATEMHRLLTGAAPEVARDGETGNQAAIRALNASGKLLSEDPAVRASAMNELRKRLATESTADKRDAIANAPVEALRDQFKVDHSKVLAPIRDRWDTEEEATILATFSQQGVAPEAVKAIHEWYSGVFNGALGNTANIDVAQVENEFRVLAKKHGIADDVADALVKHHKDRLG